MLALAWAIAILDWPSDWAAAADTVAKAIQVYGTGPVVSATFSGDGTRMAVAGPTVVHIYSLVTGEKLVSVTGHTSSINAAALSADGALLATGAQDFTARIWNASTGDEIRSFNHRSAVRAVAFTPDGLRMLTGCDDFNIRQWDIGMGTLIQEFAAHGDRITSVLYSPDGSRILSASVDRTAKLWNAATGGLEATLTGNAGAVNSAAFSPDGARIVTASSDFTARLYDASNGALIRTFFGNVVPVLSAALFPGGSKIITGAEDGDVILWNAETAQEVGQLPKHAGSVNSVAVSPSGLRILTGTGGGDQAARLWNAEDGTLILKTPGHSGELSDADFSGDGTRILTTGEVYEPDSRALLWDAASGDLLMSTPPIEAGIRTGALSPDGQKFLLGVGRFPGLQLWDADESATTPGLIRTFPTGETVAVDFSSSGSLAVSGGDTSANIWDIQTGSLLQTFSGHANYVGAVALSSDAAILATGSNDRTARIWNTDSGDWTALFTGLGDGVSSVSFSPDEKRLLVGVYGDSSAAAGLWDLATGGLIREFNCPSCDYGASAADFSPQGMRAAIGLYYGNLASLWDTETGGILRRWIGHGHRISAIRYSPDGTKVLTGSKDGTARLWDASDPPPADDPPYFTLQPKSQTVNFGQRVAFCAEAAGDGPLQFDWYPLSLPFSSAGGRTTVSLSPPAMPSLVYFQSLVFGTAGDAKSEYAYLITLDPPAPNAAEFVSHTVPARMTAGQGLFVGIVIQDTSQVSWSSTQGYALAVIDDPAGLFGGVSRIGFADLCEVVSPGDAFSFVAAIQAPLTPGVYIAKLQMTEELVEFFGPEITITVEAVPPPNAAALWTNYD